MSTVILKGLVGSKAYGLDHAGSDDDFLGIFAAPTEALFVLDPPKETVVTKGPDMTMHEVRKYCQLALSCNPTALELLWLPSYVEEHPLGRELIGIRRAFLDRHKVRNAYLGYVTQQMQRLGGKADLKRTNAIRERMGMEALTEEERHAKRAKHARHAARLLYQALDLELMGDIQVRLPRSEARHVQELGELAADGNISGLERLLATTEDAFNAPPVPSGLPDAPDLNAINVWLTRVRLQLLTARL